MVTEPQLDALAGQGERLFNRTWAPFIALRILVPSIEAVVSMTIATLYGLLAEPLMAAVAVAVSVTELMPNTLMKVVATGTCCFTWMAFAFAGATHMTPQPVRIGEHFNRGYPDAIVTFGRLERALLLPSTPLNAIAAAVAAVSGSFCAPANAAASVEAWSRLRL
jgi:hypothetical protein